MFQVRELPVRCRGLFGFHKGIEPGIPGPDLSGKAADVVALAALG